MTTIPNPTLSTPACANTSSSLPLLAELQWSVLPSALQPSVGSDYRIAISSEKLGTFGVSIYGSAEHEDAGQAGQMTAWAFVEPSSKNTPATNTQANRTHIEETTNTVIRLPLFICSTLPVTAPSLIATDVQPANFEIRNGRPDRFSLDIRDSESRPLCSLSYLVQPNGEVMYWAHSILPDRLKLAGGTYELIHADVRCLGK